MKNRYRYNKKLTIVSAAGASQTLEDVQVKAEQLIKIRNLGIINNTNNFTSATIYVNKSGYKHKYKQFNTCLVDVLYSIDYPLFIAENEILKIDFIGLNVGDNIEVFIDGLIYLKGSVKNNAI